MSSLARYRLAPSPFATYHQRFLQNTFLQRRFRIVLRDGEQAEGVPTASVATAQDPTAGFNFHASSGFYCIPYTELESAEEILAGLEPPGDRG